MNRLLLYFFGNYIGYLFIHHHSVLILCGGGGGSSQIWFCYKSIMSFVMLSFNVGVYSNGESLKCIT